MFWEVSGGVLWLYIAAALARLLYKWIIRPPTSWSDFRGEWAVVTGASQHIGRSCALALAQRGINLILVARSADKLQSVAEEIRKRFPSVQAEVLPADLTGSQAEFDRMRAALRPSERCISILLAIAGGKAPAKGMIEFAFKEFHLMTAEEEDAIYRLNCYATAQTLRLVLPDMMKRKKGRLVTMSSLSMLLPYGLSAYGASKAYVATLTDALRSECAEYNIQVQSVAPAKVGNPVVGNWMQGYCSYETFAEATLDKFDFEGSAVYYPYWMHAIMAWLCAVLPTRLRHLINRRLGRQLQEDQDKRS